MSIEIKYIEADGICTDPEYRAYRDGEELKGFGVQDARAYGVGLVKNEYLYEQGQLVGVRAMGVCTDIAEALAWLHRKAGETK